ncbi:MAG TPA: DUF4238 domain-containing protein [Methylomirabilota bacterium]|nr:DUF4238 domain-containing protein [Methylomirabilota bacterium]
MTSKAQSQPKQTNLNHFVARFTSRPWLLGTNQFYKLSTDKTGVQATAAGPRNWGGEENLYSQDVEDAFEKIENKLAHLQRKLESGSRPTDDERCGWAMWLLASYLRTPAAFLCSAEVSASMRGFTGDLFHTSYAMLASCVTNPHCIELIANRDWQILVCDKPYFLKPDTGLVLTDRLDKEDCLILYPLTPFSCFLATGNQRGFSKVPVQKKRVFGLNNHILRWSEASVACSTEFWERQQFELRPAVRTNLAAGQYSPPTSGRFFSVETVKCEGRMKATILSPRGSMLMAIPESSVRPVGGNARPKISGLYDVENRPDVALEVRYSDNEEEIDYVSAAWFMMHVGQKELAVEFARKALAKDEKNLFSKLVILASEPNANFGELIPENPNDAAELAIWLALAKHDPLEGLKVASAWLRKNSDHERLAQANFLCAFMAYGARFFQTLCGKQEHLPYIDDNTPLPDGVIEFVKRVCSHSDGGIVSEVQRQVGKMDVNASGLAADVLNFCGLNHNLRLYRTA